jgi:D-3-phosphoglycerate dehydrogenase
VAKYKIFTPAGASFTVAGGGYDYEMEALEGLDAEIVEGPANEDAFIAAAMDADAIYGKGIPISKKIIDSLTRCKLIALGSVGVDSVDVAAATARGIPVTNCPDTFIEEVADHAMTLLLAGFRQVVDQDRMVREGRWKEGRPALLKVPRLMGQTLGFIAFGRVARATVRAAVDGLRPIHRGNDDAGARRHSGDALGSPAAVGFHLHACPGDAGSTRHAQGEALQADEA